MVSDGASTRGRRLQQPRVRFFNVRCHANSYLSASRRTGIIRSCNHERKYNWPQDNCEDGRGERIPEITDEMFAGGSANLQTKSDDKHGTECEENE